MRIRLLFFAAVAAALWAQAPPTPAGAAGGRGVAADDAAVAGAGGRGGGRNAVVNRDAAVTPVPFDRILHADKEPQNWLTYSGNYNSQRYSSLNQVTPANAGDLTLKWVYQARSIDKHEVTPLVVDGIMFTVQGPNDVIALDAATGKTIWQHLYRVAQGTTNPCCGNLTHGLAVLGDKVFLATLDAKMIALDAKTGKEVWSQQVADYREQYSMTVAPLAVKDKVITGIAGGERGVRGFLVAYDANTGKEAWRFNTVPGPGEPGYETWMGKDGKPNDSYLHGGASIWETGSYDPETNLTLWGTGNAGPDYNGDNRIGDNLYTSSVVALDVDTGKLKWYYQFLPHDEFDWDATQVPVLANITFEGRPIKALLWAHRSGVTYVIDRTNGKFLSGKAFAKTNWFTGFDEKGRPMRAPGILPTKEGTLVYPGNQGATNWYSPSFSPLTNLYYIPTWENTSSIYHKDETAPVFQEGQRFSGAGPTREISGAHDEIFGSLVAWDPVARERKWTFRMSAASPEGGVLTTGSNMLFVGGRDGQFIALDARDGKLLWETNLGPSVSAGPITYLVKGKQYISVQAGNSLYTFGLR